MAALSNDDGICAIFVHAGAGFHSFENEHKHLKACDAATTTAMKFLKSGGTAVDAVEMALKVLEDDPITNAGYGSNLNHDGVVECDASIVDHRGKSGAAGAVPNVKNPISLARKIYDQSNRSVGISRVPPNFVVGEGARDFAWENGLAVVPNEDLVHPGAGGRWRQWKDDVDEYERYHSKTTTAPWLHRSLTPMQDRLNRLKEREKLATVDREAAEEGMSDLGETYSGGHATDTKTVSSLSSRDCSPEVETDTEAKSEAKLSTSDQDDLDMITDTVGAIAIDKWGNIAAGSSSGGIGMKHRGRVGPAALIGIGTHIIPIDPTDPDQTTVACVTSGTGELIASSFVAFTLSQRVYFGQKKCANGKFEPAVDQVVISEMFKNEFTGYPAVADSFISGSLGALIVRKDVYGVELFFAHNTESFVIGTMASNREKPVCVMSRGPKGSILQGGCRVRF
ncbi:hypothetical protein N7508_003255 [Penicillium antarcticum]|uniref:uncharacterized protein n=1 Tax=Penicillium antarcticum TaxID=416450 RepID=UPI0023874799|nr:uncharacterized protein N7508_003255 [Penicillium antarcticum]KAJ5312425.1 hypothetical protein N7508_003255 [Penicillium antarcticum]